MWVIVFLYAATWSLYECPGYTSLFSTIHNNEKILFIFFLLASENRVWNAIAICVSAVLGSRTLDCRKIRKICAQPPENLCDIIVGARNIHLILTARHAHISIMKLVVKFFCCFFFCVSTTQTWNIKKMCIIHETVAALRWVSCR